MSGVAGVRLERLDPISQAVERLLAEALELEGLDEPEGGGVRLVVLALGTAAVQGGRALERKCASLRARFAAARLLVLGPDLPAEYVVAALDAGADDYVRDSVPCEEFQARLRVQRRSSTNPHRATADSRAFGLLSLIPESRCVVGPQGSVLLTRTEVRLLELLMGNQTVSVDDLARVTLSAANDGNGSRGLVYRHMTNLRTKLRRVSGVEMISRAQAGYQLIEI